MADQALVLNLSVQNFRNLELVKFKPASRLNLIYGDNGHGKTSLIEALYVLCTTRSFRTGRLSETVRQGSERTEIVGQISSLGLRKQQRAAISLRGRSFSIDGKRPRRLTAYALSTPVIAFHPGDMTLVSGPARLRRTLLDRIVLHTAPAGAEARLRYQKATRERQALLDKRGTQAPELEAFETVMAEQGARLAKARAVAAARLGEALVPAIDRMATSRLGVVSHYRPGGTEDEVEFAKELGIRRKKDLLRGAATFGPQKDEMSFDLEGRPARSHASQGQQRLLTLALKFAELSCVRDVTGVEPVLLLDDVSSELDPERTEAVFHFLRQSQSQIFVTSTRRQLFDEVQMEAEQRADFRMEFGTLVPQ